MGGQWEASGRPAEGQWKASGRPVEGRWKAGGRPVEGRWKGMEGHGRPWKVRACLQLEAPLVILVRRHAVVELLHPIEDVARRLSLVARGVRGGALELRDLPIGRLAPAVEGRGRPWKVSVASCASCRMAGSHPRWRSMGGGGRRWKATGGGGRRWKQSAGQRLRHRHSKHSKALGGT